MRVFFFFFGEPSAHSVPKAHNFAAKPTIPHYKAGMSLNFCSIHNLHSYLPLDPLSL